MATAVNGSKMDSKLHAARRASAVEMEADDMLEGLGYKPELQRNRSTAQVAFMSFVLASIPYGLSTTLGYPLIGGGPVVVIWGWVAVSAIVVCVAASLGEITSVYPTAGGTAQLLFHLPLPFRLCTRCHFTSVPVLCLSWDFPAV